MLEDHVDHPGNRIGAVTGRCAITQHFDVIHRRQRDGIQIRRCRAAPHCAPEVDEGAGVAALAIDQHQYLVRRKAAQLRRAYQFGAVYQARTWKVDGRDQTSKYRAQFI